MLGRGRDGGQVTEMERDSTRLPVQLESAWRRFLALDSHLRQSKATPPFWGRDTLPLVWGLLHRPILVISPTLFLDEKNAFEEGNF